MVAVITTGRSIFGALAYNEKKLQAGEATSLGAVNSLADASRQSLHEKNRTLQGLADRNQRTKRNAYHIALSFAKGDKLSSEQLRTIAKEYLTGIGFEAQPAYVYRHHDTDNDHIHIVTTNIRSDGSRINDSFIGRTKSEEARKAIELKYDLVKAEDQPKQAQTQSSKTSLKAQAKEEINVALTNYKPSSVGELNAVLRDKGLKVIEQTGTSPKGEPYRGFVVTRISLLDGKETGASIKASKVFEKGWSDRVGKQFAENEKGKDKNLKKVRAAVKTVFEGSASSVEELREALYDRGIRAIEHRNAQGYLYGLHYVDTKGGYVYKASQIGKAYAAGEWKKREQTDGLSDDEVKRLDGVLKQYMHQRTEQFGIRSAAIQQLTVEDLQEYIQKHNFTLQSSTPHLKTFVEARRSTYPFFEKKDRKELEELQRGVERLRPEYRAAVAAAVGLVTTKDGAVHKYNSAIELRGTQLGATDRQERFVNLGRLTHQEQVLLRHAGQQGRGGAIPPWVHVQSVDWEFWKAKFPDHQSRAIEEKLYQNYLQKQLSHAAKSTKPIEYLLKRGILVEAKQDGHVVYKHDRMNYRIYTSKAASRRIGEQDYKREDFERIRTRMTEPVVIEVLNQLDVANNPSLRSRTDALLKKQLKNSPNVLSSTVQARNKLADYIGAQAPGMQRKGLYELTQKNTDEEETPQQRQRKRQRQRQI